MNCIVCGKKLSGRQTKMCSVKCRSKYWSKNLKGKPSFFKGKKHKESSINLTKEKLSGENHYNYKDGMSTHKRTAALKRHNMTLSEYDILFKEQNGVCAICKKPELVRNYLSVDHDHRCCNFKKGCGMCVRGLLCSRCNMALGLLNDDILILENSIKYLSKTR